MSIIAIQEQLDMLLKEHSDALVYLNLSNGLDAYDSVASTGISADRTRFSYIQSTQLERRSHDVLICSLGADMLMELALGRTCVIVDFGSDKEVSRAVYQGVPFVRYCLKLGWFGEEDDNVMISPRRFGERPIPVGEDFRRRYHELDRKTKSFIKKFARYATLASSTARHHGEPLLFGISARSENDGHPEHYEAIASHIADTRANSA